jgi:hypothetical protein
MRGEAGRQRANAWPGRELAELARTCEGGDDDQASYYHAVFYMTGALWVMGAGDRAISALGAVLATVTEEKRGALPQRWQA